MSDLYYVSYKKFTLGLLTASLKKGQVKHLQLRHNESLENHA